MAAILCTLIACRPNGHLRGDALGLIQRLGKPDLIPYGGQSARLFSSADPTGGNEDYGHFLRDGPPGWKVMADAAGPAYLSRFWFTGAADGSLRLRFYFDDESSPRIETTLADWCGGQFPAVPPLAAYENYAWYSFLPLPFRRRLVIMCEAPRPNEKFFYQIQVQTLPRHSVVSSFSGYWSDADREVLERIAAGGTTSLNSIPARDLGEWREIAPNAVITLAELEGPAWLTRWALEIDPESVPDPAVRLDLLRNLMIECTWDDAPGPSVAAPLGLFFGGWRYRVSHATARWRVDGWRFECRWPMPFRRKAHWALRHQGNVALRARWGFHSKPAPAETPDAPMYFHAQYRRSMAGAGVPHPILSLRGRGVYAGMVLDVAALEPTYWILEGDEFIRLDDEPRPRWRGTGLEDYFNGGWYYQHTLARPWHGLTFKAPFRATQYRLHALDAVPFEHSFEMEFERLAPGAMESLAFVYLDQPTPVSLRDLDRERAAEVTLPIEEQTLMTELTELERFEDLSAALEYLEAWMSRKPAHARADMLRLRAAAYRAELGGEPEAWRDTLRRAASSGDPRVRRAAEDALWVHEAPGRALAFLFANTPAILQLNGEEILRTDAPHVVARARVELREPPRALTVLARRRPYPDWALAVLRTAEADYVTTPAWRVGGSDWSYSVDTAQSAHWPRVGGTGVKGPPEEPYLWVEPDPFIGVISGAVGLRPPERLRQGEWAVFHWSADDPASRESMRPRSTADGGVR